MNLQGLSSTLRRAVMLLLCGAAMAFPAGAQGAAEAAVKAAYIYRFLEYVTWPSHSFAAPDEPIVVGTLRSGEVTAALQRIAAERVVQNRRLKVVHLKEVGDQPVHVLYVPRLDPTRLSRVMEAARQRPILTVTDLADGLDRGAVINFVAAAGRIQFEVSLDAATRSGLGISSRLLEVAQRVKRGEVGTPYFARVPRAPLPRAHETPARGRGAALGDPDAALLAGDLHASRMLR